VAAAWLDERRHQERPDLGAIADFTLTAQDGHALGRADLQGSPWIADFVFTRCSGPCPLITGNMARLARDLASSEVRFVSFSVDPEHDTPDVLAGYARSFQADARWSFLTGDRARVTDLLRGSFKVGMEKSPDPKTPVGEMVAHSTKMVLVGRDARIRGYYDGSDPADVERLLADARDLGRPIGTGRSSPLPLLNASLNALAGLLLVLGLVFIRAKKIGAHKASMLGALVVSGVFLASYLVYHAQHGSTPFLGHGWLRPAYFTILISHVLLAIAVVPLAFGSAVLGLKGLFPRHVFIARIAFPIWLYVSVTGVAVYILLYEIAKP
jgi:protein SCO1/2/putative membrane protein